MNLLVPTEILKWIDEKRGEQSRAAFMIKCLRKIMEIDKY